MLENPLAEVFGFPTNNLSTKAERFRNNKLCPFNNRVPSCTKDKANDPLGVCSIYHDDEAVITCPIRFRQDWLVVEDAARFLFGKNKSWTSLSEVKLTDKYGGVAGNIDLVLVAYDHRGRITDFGSLEIQAVYISGNIRRPFESYISNRKHGKEINWTAPNFPKPDFLSSSRKRLVPQMLYKGGILKTWKKKQAVVLQRSFFDTLPELKTIKIEKADIAWLLYDLQLDEAGEQFNLIHTKTVYTEFAPALEKITTPEPGNIEDFVGVLQEKLDEKLDGHPPEAPTLTEIII